mmetsp:Transcript_24310/g.35358  ORF Transcript_24310/g.35358 Transcript_24310/m.35358 type:complete len:299 (-) Transcript_24310:113-1009(-)
MYKVYNRLARHAIREPVSNHVLVCRNQHTLSTETPRCPTNPRHFSDLEIHIIVVSNIIVGQHGHFLVQGVLLRLVLCILLLLACDPLEAAEIFPLQLVELALDVGQDALDARDRHILQGVAAPVGHLECFVHSDVGGLQGGQLHQGHQEGLELGPAVGNGSPTPSQTQVLFLLGGCLILHENGQLDPRHVVDAVVHAHAGAVPTPVYHLCAEVPCGVLGLREGEEGGLGLVRNVLLVAVDLLHDLAVPRLQSVRLLLEQFKAFLGSYSLSFEHSQSHTCGGYICSRHFELFLLKCKSK